MKKMDDEIFLVNIPGEVPAKKNSRINTKSGKSFPSKSYRAWHDGSIVLLCAEARRQGVTRPVDRPCAIFLSIRHRDHRRRDSDNVLSSVLDLLVDAGILADDRWHIVRQVHVDSGLGEPRCRVSIILLEGESLEGTC